MKITSARFSAEQAQLSRPDLVTQTCSTKGTRTFYDAATCLLAGSLRPLTHPVSVSQCGMLGTGVPHLGHTSTLAHPFVCFPGRQGGFRLIPVHHGSLVTPVQKSSRGPNQRYPQSERRFYLRLKGY
jgi:hypothetical protein